MAVGRKLTADKERVWKISGNELAYDFYEIIIIG